MKKLLICLPLLLVAVQASAQLEKQRAEASASVMVKAAQLDLLNQLLPLLFTKEQWRKLLPAVEKSRDRVRSTERNEAEELLKLEKKISDAYVAATERGELPKPELLNEYHAKFGAFDKVRRAMAEQNIFEVTKLFNEVANAGQKKTAMNSLSPRMFGKVEELKDDEKIRLFISEVMLHPLSYELMRKLSLGN